MPRPPRRISSDERDERRQWRFQYLYLSPGRQERFARYRRANERSGSDSAAVENKRQYRTAPSAQASPSRSDSRRRHLAHRGRRNKSGVSIHKGIEIITGNEVGALPPWQFRPDGAGKYSVVLRPLSPCGEGPSRTPLPLRERRRTLEIGTKTWWKPEVVEQSEPHGRLYSNVKSYKPRGDPSGWKLVVVESLPHISLRLTYYA